MNRFPAHFRGLALFIALAIASAAWAHVEWTQVNTIDPAVVAIYHFDGNATAVGNVVAPAGGFDAGHGLTVGTTSGAGTTAVSDTPGAIFAPHALRFDSTQDLITPATFADLDGDLTIECWFKWDPAVTSQTLTLGLASGAKLRIARDTAVPANDRFGVEFTHGDYVSAPGFSNWGAVGEEEASTGEWRHYAVSIHSTGMTFDPGSGHDKYNAGSTATLWLNGHATGSAPHAFSVSGMRVHDASKIRVRSTGGGVFVDELTIWRKDWGDQGLASNPFQDGRGSGAADAHGWRAYE